MAGPRFAVVMAGGRGERFWPLSRLGRPKQIMPLPGGGTLLARTVERLSPLFPPARILVVTSQEMAAPVRHHLPLLPPENILEEPVGRDTAPCVALSAVVLSAREPDAVSAVLPADHEIRNVPAFHRCLSAAMDLAEEGRLVTIGIPPREPATGYGYIRRGEALAGPAGSRAFRVAAFREKPDRATAHAYVHSGEHYWNSGIFAWKVSAIRDALGRLAPDIARAFDPLAGHYGKSSFGSALAKAYESVRRISIDYAVMERAPDAAVLEGTFEWDDIGAWEAFLRRFPEAAQGSTVVAVDSPGGVAVSTDPAHLVALLGVPNLLVIHDRDVTLVCPRDREQEVRALVARLREEGRTPYL